MSTTLTNYGQAPAPTAAPAKRPTGWIVATVTAASLALVGMIAAVLMAFAPAPAPAPTPVAPANHAAVIPSHKVTPDHVTPVKPHVTPSASVELLQRELGQLNYYEGPITGYENQATIQAITYLQRDAHLPQTGTMNTATQQALAKMLATGNNTMGSGN